MKQTKDWLTHQDECFFCHALLPRGYEEKDGYSLFYVEDGKFVATTSYDQEGTTTELLGAHTDCLQPHLSA